MDHKAYFWQIKEGKMSPPKASQTLGMNILSVDAKAGTLEAEFEGKEEFTNPAGNIQGGFLAAMLDETMGPALMAQLSGDEFAPTLNLNIQFLAPAKPGKLRGIGRIVKRGKQTYFLSGELMQDEQIIATATATGAIRKF